MSKRFRSEEATPVQERATKSSTSEADFFKEKLVRLARAHAALLSSLGDKKGGRHEISTAGSGEAALGSSSNNFSAMGDDNEEGEGRNSAKNSEGLTTNDSAANSCSMVSAASSRSGSLRPSDVFQPQNHAFAELIVDSGEVLCKVPELGSWLRLRSPSDKYEGETVDSRRTNFGENAVSKQDERGEANPSSPSHCRTAPASRKPAAANPPRIHVRVGVGVVVRDPRNPRKVFAGKRKGSHGAGSLALPGGHLEMYETWKECAIREVEEEMGIVICNVRFAHVTNDPMQSESKHYVTIFMTAEFRDPGAKPTNCELHKCEGWDSYSWEELRELNRSDCGGNGLRLFGPLRHLVEDEPKQVLQFLES